MRKGTAEGMSGENSGAESSGAESSGAEQEVEVRRRRRWWRVRRRLLILSTFICLLILAVGVVRRLTVRRDALVGPVVPSIPNPGSLGPPGIVLHHSESPAVYHGVPVNAARLDDIHRHDHPDWATVCNGKTYYIAYHYVILPNGTIEQGRPENCVGTHARTHNDWLGICLIGGFQTNNHWFPERPTKRQMRALIGLCERLMSKYHIPPDLVKRHRDINDTFCPGDRFPYNFLLTQLRGYAATHPETRPIANRIVSLAHPPPPGRKKKKKTPAANTLKELKELKELKDLKNKSVKTNPPKMVARTFKE